MLNKPHAVLKILDGLEGVSLEGVSTRNEKIVLPRRLLSALENHQLLNVFHIDT